jgi:hypothetical protein
MLRPGTGLRSGSHGTASAWNYLQRSRHGPPGGRPQHAPPTLPLPARPQTPRCAAGARTSFKLASGVRLGDAVKRNKAALPEGFADGLWCDKYEERLTAAVRTWLRPHAQDNLM